MSYKENRKLKLVEQSGYGIPEKRPSLKLQGKWLAELGFNIGDQVNVKCDNNQLIITKVASSNEKIAL